MRNMIASPLMLMAIVAQSFAQVAVPDSAFVITFDKARAEGKLDVAPHDLLFLYPDGRTVVLGHVDQHNVVSWSDEATAEVLRQVLQTEIDAVQFRINEQLAAKKSQ